MLIASSIQYTINFGLVYSSNSLSLAILCSHQQVKHAISFLQTRNCCSDLMRMRIRMLTATPHRSNVCLNLIMGAKFVLFELLLALSYWRYVEPSVFTKQFSQNTVELLPCKERTATVSLYNSTLFTIMANLTYCPEMDTRIDTIVSQVLAT